MISAKVVADSLSPKGNRLTTLEVVMPRYILAEFNTHRVLSKNSASSRAIPLRKMIKEVMENPFIPYAFQKNHTGMQGTEYLDTTKLYSIDEFMENTHTMLSTLHYKDHNDYVKQSEKYSEKLTLISDIINRGVLDVSIIDEKKTLVDWWLFARDRAVECASILYIFDVTKQLANRLLEPFMYHKVLVSGTEFENFFNLRTPIYEIDIDNLEQYKI